MNTDFIVILLLLIIPLILMILCYRKYINNYCNNDITCLKNRLLNNLNNLNEKLRYKKNELENIQNNLYDDLLHENKEDVVEGFFDGLSSLFSSTPNNGLPVSPGTLDNQNINILEKKISDRMKVSSSFPPNNNDDKDKDSDNNELLNSINNSNKNTVKNVNNNEVQIKENIKTIPKNINIDSSLVRETKEKNHLELSPNNIEKKPVIVQPLKNVLGTCNFFNDKCPDDYQPLGNFSISGSGNNTILSCGNVDNVKPAKAIAQIKSNSVHEINILDPGLGFNPSKPPKIYIEGGKGNGAQAEAVIDDNGYLKIIKIINPGYNYTETPNIIIEAPFMNSSCHLCCKI
jgi:hypothetical protein